VAGTERAILVPPTSGALLVRRCGQPCLESPLVTYRRYGDPRQRRAVPVCQGSELPHRDGSPARRQPRQSGWRRRLPGRCLPQYPGYGTQYLRCRSTRTCAADPDIPRCQGGWDAAQAAPITSTVPFTCLVGSLKPVPEAVTSGWHPTLRRGLAGMGRSSRRIPMAFGTGAGRNGERMAEAGLSRVSP
jgi:hypothetical protein